MQHINVFRSICKHDYTHRYKNILYAEVRLQYTIPFIYFFNCTVIPNITHPFILPFWSVVLQ